MPSSSRLTRRCLIKRTAAGAALGFPFIVRASALGRDGAVAPSNRLNVGCIGVGGQGKYVMNGFLKSPDARVVAVCDPKTDKREEARNIVNKHYGHDDCKGYNDFRELIARDDIDVVQIASTDTWHVLHALAAVRAGKHVYVEKPLAMSIEELKVLREVCKQHKPRFQFGTQQRSSPQFRQACELVLNGRIGRLHTIRVSAPSAAYELAGEPAGKVEPVPEGFDYDLWLGPSPKAPYTHKRVTSPWWFHISDYSLGYISGWGIHHIDIAQWGSGQQLSGPVEVEGKATFPKNDLCDDMLSWDVHYRYADGVKVHFTSDGGPNAHGTRFEGDEGWIHVDRAKMTAEPKSLLNEKIGPNDKVHLPVSTQHQQNLLDAIKKGHDTICPLEVAIRSDTVCQLSHMACRLGRKLRWNPEKEEFIDDPEATRRMKRPMRGPWRLS